MASPFPTLLPSITPLIQFPANTSALHAPSISVYNPSYADPLCITFALSCPSIPSLLLAVDYSLTQSIPLSERSSAVILPFPLPIASL